VFAADRADNFAVRCDIGVHLVKIHALHVHLMAAGSRFNELVCAVAGMACAAVHQRIAEIAHMTGGDPCLGIHQDCGVQPDVIGAFLHKFLPPGAFDIVFQFHTERSIIPCIRKSAVNFGTGVNESAVFTKSDNFVHGLFFFFHGKTHPFAPGAVIGRCAAFFPHQAYLYQFNPCRV